MRTIVIGINNLDKKLNQSNWTECCLEINRTIKTMIEVHLSVEMDEKLCWICSANSVNIINILKERLRNISLCYKLEAIAFTEGHTEYL